MKLSFNQPVILPWGGFFARLLLSDAMILLDDTHYAQGFTFVNRNRIKAPSGQLWFTVPIMKKGKGKQKINELIIYQKAKWAKKFLSTITHCYGKSVFFNSIYSKLEEIMKENNPSFMQLALNLLKLCCEELGVQKSFILQSSLNINEQGTALIISLANKLNTDKIILTYHSKKHLDIDLISKSNIKITFLKYDQLPYPQFWGNFINNLSILDTLLCLGPYSREIILKSIILR